jgi:DNA-binding NtrC family response regulator
MTSTILIADDDPVQRRLLEAMTRRFGYEVETVESGEQALFRMTQAGAPPISLLVLDLVMPDLDGMGVLGRMRELKLTTPVIVQTAHGSIETVISAMRAGAQDLSRSAPSGCKSRSRTPCRSTRSPAKCAA